MRIREVLATTALLLATAACTDTAPEAKPSATPTPPPTAIPAPQPPVNACYDLRYSAAIAPTSDAKPVPCRTPHTVRTYFVGQAATVTADGHLLAVDSAKVRAQMARECPRRFAAYVGGSGEQRRLSMLSPTWFGPTLEESDAGQSWFRCDVIALAAEGRLAQLGGNLRKVLDKEAGRERWGRCATAKPGSRGAHQVICSARSSWRAVATLDVKDLKKARAAGGACEDRVRDLADDKLSFTWGWTPPTPAQWRAGQRYGFCWAPKGQ